MAKLILAIFMGLMSGISLAQGVADISPWEKTGKNSWELPFSKGSDEAVIHMIKRDDGIYFFLKAECVKPGRVVSLMWKMGDKVARGKDCLGDSHTYETKKLEGWINPLPREVREESKASTKKKRKVEQPLSAKKLMRLV